MFSHHGELGISLMYSSSRVRLQKLWEGEKGEKESFEVREKFWYEMGKRKRKLEKYKEKTRLERKKVRIRDKLQQKRGWKIELL